MEKRQTCLNCQTPLSGRTDKRFCDNNCKSAYHNQNPDSNENYIKEINKQLRRNRSALRYACPQGKATVRKDFLEKLGMNFNYNTHSWSSQNGSTYQFCYDYGYAQVDDPLKVLIIQKQAYMTV
jgi:hypothetical protein